MAAFGHSDTGILYFFPVSLDLIVENDPETVRMDVTADLAGGISVTLHYYLSVQE